ncbi:MAG: hypothetical protein K6B46_05390 [Opitutales bacterium]|nr:hypothetical protein [Opitutales bacterium]
MEKSEIDKIVWCDVRLGRDYNWWCLEFNVPVHWDPFDSISIIDPRQVAFMLEKMEEMRDYGLDDNIVEAAFITFQLEKTLPEKKAAHLLRVNESIFGTSDDVGKTLFALPKTFDETDSCYEEFLRHITRLRVRYLNDKLDAASKISETEVEEQLRDNQNRVTMEGRALHVFTEILNILEYKPEGLVLKTDTESGSEIFERRGQEDVTSALQESGLQTPDADFDPDMEEYDENGNLINKKKKRRGRRPNSERNDFGGGGDAFIK